MRASHSCQSCSRRKRKCDLKKPGCSRCLKLKIPCHWPDSVRLATYQQQQHESDWMQSLLVKMQGVRRPLETVKMHQMAGLWWPLPQQQNNVHSGQHGQVLDILSTEASELLSSDAWLTVPIPQRQDSLVSIMSEQTPDWLFIEDSQSPAQASSPDFFTSSIQETHPSNSLLPSIKHKRDACIDVFFTCFCTEMGFLPSTLAWKQLLPSIMASAAGVRDAIAAVGGLYAHKRVKGQGKATDAMGYYAASVHALQKALTPSHASEKVGVPGVDAMVGIAILMIFELMSGNREGYAAHVSALASMLQQLGPAACRTGIPALLFASILKPEQDTALISGRDTFLANDDWLALAQAQFPGAVSKFCRLFAVSARVMARENAFKQQVLTCFAAGLPVPVSLPEARRANEEKAMSCLSQLRESLATVERMQLFNPSPSDYAWPRLSASPFLPSIRAKYVQLTGFYPMMAALIVKLDACFDRHSAETEVLARKCVMLSQDVICRGGEPGVLVRQITPLMLVQPFLFKAEEKAWLSELRGMMDEQGFAIARP
ncbi:hypothetical protein BCR37DRAFT_375840 [Protomyces lactucae-debilis]|uniref:Zn(2)-C6 fungal-type domain-containing protein n=1 Tax=Protomyces lactucae-debilis TaxID=2754530 RepID=A0A1Y2FV68_PROLT|nr:uncharacterized protein BCR37DRAFT_375840 [Protomyces lactucae-debilis]ORY87888.1 hypothetical protein BCR37DRAFT_375840 [Protomyces lactucae-debilis]